MITNTNNYFYFNQEILICDPDGLGNFKAKWDRGTERCLGGNIFLEEREIFTGDEWVDTRSVEGQRIIREMELK